MVNKSKKKKSVGKILNDDPTIPRSFVFHRGVVGTTIMQLIEDTKHVMEPYTAVKLKVRKANVMKDFVNVAGPLGITHFMTYSKTEKAPYMKLLRLPRGPTLTFKVDEYALMKDVTSILKRPKTIGSQFKYPPLLVLNNFNTETAHMKLLTTTLQNMFPSIKIQKVKLGEIRRCVMFNYEKETNTITFRHYNIEAVPVGVSRGVKKLLKNRLPNLGQLDDISDLMTGAAYLSESEGEEPAESQVKLPQKIHGKGNLKSSQSCIKLTELGPRMTLELIKIEDGICEGEVLYHKYVKKTEEEVALLKKKKEQRKKEKEKRKKQQEENVKRKEKEKEDNKTRSMAGMKRKWGDTPSTKKRTTEDAGDAESGDEQSDDEDEKEVVDEEPSDAEYYRQEVGEEPEEELFAKRDKTVGPKKQYDGPKKTRDGPPNKKFRKDHNSKQMESKQNKFGDKKFGDKKFGDKKFGDKKFGDKKFGDKDNKSKSKFGKKDNNKSLHRDGRKLNKSPHKTKFKRNSKK